MTGSAPALALLKPGATDIIKSTMPKIVKAVITLLFLLSIMMVRWNFQ
jgi:hypothetical protein